MATLSLGFDELKRRLGLVRGRLNAYAFQDAVYRSGCIIFSAAILALIARHYASERMADRLPWAFALLSLGATGFFASRLRRRWLSLDAVARLADREANLECRLATILAQEQSIGRSRLRGVLLSEVFVLAARWAPKRIAPRVVPRSFYAFCAALAALTTSLLLAPERPNDPAAQQPTAASAENAPAPHPGGESQPIRVAAAPPEAGVTGSPAGEQAQQGATGAGDGNAGAAQRPAPPGHQAGGDTGAEKGAAGLAPGREKGVAGLAPGGERKGQAAAQPPGEGLAGDGVPGEDDSDAGQHASPEQAAARQTGAQDAERRPATAPERDGDPAGADQEATSGQRPKLAKGKDAAADEAKRGDATRDAAGEKANDARAGKPTGGAGADRNSGGDGGDKGGLYGERGDPPTSSAEAAAMLIKLTAFTSTAPEDFETQGEAGRVSGAPTDDSRSGEEIELAAQLEREMPLVRAPLAAEHEAMLRNIFTPRR